MSLAPHAIVAGNGWTPQRKLPWSGSFAPIGSEIDAPSVSEIEAPPVSAGVCAVPEQGGIVGSATTTWMLVVAVPIGPIEPTTSTVTLIVVDPALAPPVTVTT